MRKALLKAIDIWERRAAGEEVNEACPLCEKFVWCRGCPVDERTGSKCEGTPYEGWDATDGDVVYAAQEVEFLRSLL